MKQLTDVRLIVAFVLLLAGAGCSNVSVAPGPEPAADREEGVTHETRQTYIKALTLMKKGKYAAAEPLLLDLTGGDPELSGPYANLGIVYSETGRLVEAEQALRQAIRINPANGETYNRLAVLLREQGKFPEALDVYRQALNVQPDNRHAHYNLGILYDLYLGQPQQALSEYEAYLALAGEDRTVSMWVLDLKRQLKEKM